MRPSEAVELQRALSDRVREEPLRRPVRWVAGADVAVGRRGEEGRAAVVVVDLARGLEVVERVLVRGAIRFPYVPGLLSFREGPLLLEAFARLPRRPDAVLFDAQGRAHPRRLGLASHLGLLLDLPSVGVAKSRLVGEHREPGRRRGSWTPLIDRGERIGAVLRTRDDVRPVFVSVGHLIDLPGAVELVLRCHGGTRIPVPTREADRLVRRGR